MLFYKVEDNLVLEDYSGHQQESIVLTILTMIMKTDFIEKSALVIIF